MTGVLAEGPCSSTPSPRSKDVKAPGEAFPPPDSFRRRRSFTRWRCGGLGLIVGYLLNYAEQLTARRSCFEPQRGRSLVVIAARRVRMCPLSFSFCRESWKQPATGSPRHRNLESASRAKQTSRSGTAHLSRSGGRSEFHPRCFRVPHAACSPGPRGPQQPSQTAASMVY